MTLWQQTVGIIHKDLLLEWRGRARLNAVLIFAMLTLLLFSFAVGPQPKLLAALAPGFFWLAVLLASVLSLGESLRVEQENAALEGLRLLPVAPLAIFLGKALANMLFLFALAVVLTPITLALYDAPLQMGLVTFAQVIALGVGAISAPGTLYAAMAVQARSRDILLPLLLFPILVPGLLAAVKATALVMHGDAMGELTSWQSLLIAFNTIYWLLCMLLFGRVIEP